MDPLLEALSLQVRYGGRSAVDGLSFAVRSGEILGFLGPNGAGKTTTFQALVGLIAPSAGELRFRSRPISPTSAGYRQRLGVVFQKPSLDDKLTCSENLALGAALYGVSGRALAPRLGAALVLAELVDRAAEPVGRLSGGLRRRLELARVLMHDPEVLILDEPTVGLDPAFLRRFWRQVRAIRDERNLAVLVTTHDPHEAEQCDRLVILDRGRVVAEGTPAELKARVGGDVITIDAPEPEDLAHVLSEQLGLEPSVIAGRVVMAHDVAHTLIPRIVELFPPGRVLGIDVHAPNLADVFVKLTGRSLEPWAG